MAEGQTEPVFVGIPQRMIASDEFRAGFGNPAFDESV
jgi:hypothetical protein